MGEFQTFFKKVHHLLKLQASNKGIKQMLFLLFSNFLTLPCNFLLVEPTQLTFACSNLTTESLEKDMKYVQSQQ